MYKSNLIRDLLEAKEPYFSLSVRELELATGNNVALKELSLYVRQSFNLKLKELMLEPDANDDEIYLALLKRVRDDNSRLAKILGIKNSNSPTEVEDNVLHITNNLTINKEAWVINENTAKKMLLAMPPEKAANLLKYKTAKEMIEKHDIYELFGLIRFSEGPEWLNRFNAQYNQLEPTDFERREIKFKQLPQILAPAAKKFIAKKKHNLTHSKEMGVVYFLPVEGDIPGALLRIMPLSFHYINEIRMYSAYFKLNKRRTDFGKRVTSALVAEPEILKLSDFGLKWGLIQRYFGKLKDEKHPEEFLPHLQPEDLHWRKSEDIIYQLDPEFKFWQNMDWVAKLSKDGSPLTMNFMDVSLSFSNKVKFKDRLFYHFRESLWDQLMISFAGESEVESLIIAHLDNSPVDVSNLTSSIKKER
jgi:hypothetical protein